MSNIHEIGDQVQYPDPDTGEIRIGVIHGVRKTETDGRTKIVGYLIDTGEDERVDEIITSEDEDNITVRQPKQADVDPESVRAIAA